MELKFFRPSPPLPDLEISKASVGKLADVMREGANYVLSIILLKASSQLVKT